MTYQGGQMVTGHIPLVDESAKEGRHAWARWGEVAEFHPLRLEPGVDYVGRHRITRHWIRRFVSSEPFGPSFRININHWN